MRGSEDGLERGMAAIKWIGVSRVSVFLPLLTSSQQRGGVLFAATDNSSLTTGI